MSSHPLADSHCHLDADAFAADRARVLNAARSAGVDTIVIPAVEAAGWSGLAELCADEPGLYPAWGLHPMFLDRHRPEHLTRLDDWLRERRPVAVGECGLDGFVPGLDWQAQQHYFQAQLDLAVEHDLPVIVHARRAVDAVIAALRARPGLRGVVHSFSGSEQQAGQLFDLGIHLGIGGPVTYERAKRLRRIVATMPVELLLLETDAPDQPLSGFQGQRNEPARLPMVLDCVARLRHCAPAELAAQTRENTRRLFGLSG